MGPGGVPRVGKRFPALKKIQGVKSPMHQSKPSKGRPTCWALGFPKENNKKSMAPHFAGNPSFRGWISLLSIF